MNVNDQIRYWAQLVNESEGINETRANDNRSIDERLVQIAREVDKIKTRGRDYIQDVFDAIIRNIDVTNEFDTLYRKAYDGDEKAKDDFYYIINPIELEKYDFGKNSSFHGTTKAEFLERIFKYLDFFNGNMDKEECEQYVKEAKAIRRQFRKDVTTNNQDERDFALRDKALR